MATAQIFFSVDSVGHLLSPHTPNLRVFHSLTDSTRFLKQAAQETERASLEAKLKKRENGLIEGCRRQVHALRRRHVVRLKAAQAAVPGTRRDVSITNGLSAATIPPNAAAEQSGSETGEESATAGNPRTLEEGQGESGVVQRSSPRFPTVAAAVTGHAHTKKQIELREQLARHLAAAGNPERGHQHLQDAARVVKVIEKLELETRQEAEVGRSAKFPVRLRMFLVAKAYLHVKVSSQILPYIFNMAMRRL